MGKRPQSAASDTESDMRHPWLCVASWVCGAGVQYTPDETSILKSHAHADPHCAGRRIRLRCLSRDRVGSTSRTGSGDGDASGPRVFQASDVFPSLSCPRSRSDRILVPMPSSAGMRSPVTASSRSLSGRSSSVTSSARDGRGKSRRRTPWRWSVEDDWPASPRSRWSTVRAWQACTVEAHAWSRWRRCGSPVVSVSVRRSCGMRVTRPFRMPMTSAVALLTSSGPLWLRVQQMRSPARSSDSFGVADFGAGLRPPISEGFETTVAPRMPYVRSIGERFWRRHGARGRALVNGGRVLTPCFGTPTPARGSAMRIDSARFLHDGYGAQNIRERRG